MAQIGREISRSSREMFWSKTRCRCERNAIVLLACALSVPAAWSQAAPSVPAHAVAAPAAARALPSMLDQSPQPPTIHLDNGKLTIEATNSSLRAILDDLGKRTGTRIDGLNHDERIFGVYGPGNPQQVLASLLDDSGYNVLISGLGPDGAPREIELSSRTATSTAAPAAAGVTQAAAEDDDSDAADTQAPPPPQPRPIDQVPANGQPAGQPQQVKTPAEMLQELQQLRQSQQQQSPPQ